MIINCLLIGCGGFVGSVLRYLVGLIPLKSLNGGFPIKTLIVNVLGAFLLSILIEMFIHNKEFSTEVSLMLRTGFCGGFTTFSTFACETFTLAEKGHLFGAIVYVILTIILGMAAVVTGKYLYYLY